MAYAQKYLFRWDSSNGTTREIRILKDGYTGGVLQRALGRAPILKKQQSGPVCGTSLEIYAECLVDGEFAEFYVTDPKAYRVELYEGARLLWTGFVTPELYAEPDIAPPYDVQIIATDGVGELKLYDFPALGTRSLRQIFTYLLSYTGVGTDLQLISSLRVDGGGAGELLDKYINLDYLSGKTCYEVLTYLLTTLHATITRWGGAWIISRETNVTVQDGAVQCFALDGGPVSLHESVKTLGKLSVNEIWPVGQLTQKVEPARRSMTVQAPWHTVGCTKLLNSDMMEDAAWIRASGATYDTDRKRYKAPQLPHFPNQVVKLPTIYQSFEMDGLRVPMAFSAWFTAAFFISPIESNIIDNRRLTVLITYTVGDTVYHLRSGAMGPIWMPGDAVDAENIREDKMTLDFKADAVAYDADRVSAQELRIDNIPTLGRGESHPAGTLTIYLIGECVYIYGARLDAQLPKGYQDRLHLANGARGEGDTVEVAFGRVTADASYYKEFLSGVLLDGDKLVTAYQDAALTEPTDYLSFISRDYARSIALPRIKRTGVVYLERSVHYPPLMLSQGAVDYWLETWSWNLCEDELDISATSLPVAVIEVESEVIAEASDGSASPGSSSSGSSSITASGGASFFERGDNNEVRLRASYELLTAPAFSLGQTFNERPSLLSYDPDSDAWRLSGNLLVDGFITAGGKGESSSGGGSADYTQWGWEDIIRLTSDPGLGNLASAWALKQEYDSRQSALSVISQGLSSIRLLIPSSASESNQLADKEFVNSSIASNTATFRGTFEGVSYLPSGAKLNDYAFVIATDASGNPEYNRYKYTASGWVFEYTLNNSSFTAEQWSAITSGITANLVSLYSAHIGDSTIHITANERDAWNNKWDYNEDTIKAVKVNNAIKADTAEYALTLRYIDRSNTNYGNYVAFQQLYAKRDFPHLGWFNSIKMLHGNTNGYFTEIAISFTNEDGMWRRSLLNGKQVGWYKILDSGNYNSYSPKLDGTGAIGTWGINISGNAASATKLQTPRTIWGQSFDGTGNISGDMTGVGSITASGNITIESISLKGDNDAKLTYDNGAWHLSGNLLVDGYITAGGVGSSSGGGGLDSAAMWALLGDATSEQINKTHISSALEGYQSIIPDLATIRSNAANGNTAYGYFTNGKLPYTSVSGTPDLSDMATKTWVNVQGYLTGITSSMVTSALGYTPYNASNPNGYISGISKAMVENVLTGDITSHTHSFASLTSKPTTLSEYGITDAIHLDLTPNYIGARFPNGENAVGNKYLEWYNDAGWVHHRAGKYSVPGGTSSQFLKADGSVDSTAYLPLSGGVMTGAIVVGPYTSFGVSGTNFYLGSPEYPLLIRSNGTTTINGNTLIHSGNIGSQSVDYATRAARLSVTWNEDPNYTSGSNLKLINNSSGTQGNYPNGYSSGLSVMTDYVGWQMMSYGGGEQNPYFRSYQDNGNWKPWRKLAFLDDNVASATRLQTPRTIWGQSFNGTANVSGDMTGVGSITASGNILASGAITAGTASDSRLKSNIATICNASSVLRQLRGVGFDWNALATDKSSYFKGHDVGLIAQEVEPLIPSAIGTIWGEYKRLDYAKITPYLVEGWKEHDTEINRLRARVSELESEVNKLRKYVN